MSHGIAEAFRRVGFTALLLLSGAAIACNPAPNPKNSGETQARNAGAAAMSSGSSDPRINLQCAADNIQKAPAPFHWSFKKIVTPDMNADWEADVTAEVIGGTLIDSSGTRVIHGTLSDRTSWNTAVMILSGPLPASTFALVNHSSGIVRAGSENVNGQDTIKYKIDTALDSSADASLIHSVLGAAGFIKGTAWVTSSGCPVKFILDVEQHNQDGTVGREHYEENVTKE